MRYKRNVKYILVGKVPCIVQKIRTGDRRKSEDDFPVFGRAFAERRNQEISNVCPVSIREKGIFKPGLRERCHIVPQWQVESQ